MLAFGITPKVFSASYENARSLSPLEMLHGHRDDSVWVDN